MKPNICQVFLTITLLSAPAVVHAGDVGGTTFQNLSQAMTIYTLKSDLDAKAERREVLKQKIAKQIEEAKALSAKTLSAEELAKIKAHAEEVIREAKEEIKKLDAELAGALVICSSQIIEEVK